MDTKGALNGDRRQIEQTPHIKKEQLRSWGQNEQLNKKNSRAQTSTRVRRARRGQGHTEALKQKGDAGAPTKILFGISQVKRLG